jgi:hypothetical protein
VLTQSLTPSQLPDRVFKRQGSFRGAPRYVQIAIPQPEQLPCEVFVIDGETYVPVQVVNEPDWAGDANLPPIDDAVEAKRARLLAMQSATFHYLDAAGVREVYAQEMAAVASAPASGINPMDEPWLTQPDTATTPTGEPAPTGEPSPEAMFLAYQRRIIAKNEAVLDLEFEHRKPEALIQLDRVLRWLKNKHPAVLAPEPSIRKTRERIAREETGKQMDRLRSGGRAIIHAAFTISHPQPEVARLSLLCPATYAFPETVRIDVNVKTERIAESWRDQYAMESSITAHVMGTPLNWEKQTIGADDAREEIWVVSLKPFAIYS